MAVFLAGIIAGIYGYFLPGNINVMVMELYAQKRKKLLVMVFLLIVFFEISYCIVTVSFLTRFSEQPTFQFYLRFVTSILLFIIGFILLLPPAQNTQSKTIDRSTKAGIFSIVIHPQQISFWVLFLATTQPFFDVSNSNSFIYVLTIANVLGVLLIMFGYMYFGNHIVNKLSVNITFIKRGIGGFYILLSGIHIKMLVFN
jgi:uncharacterized membrane protein YqjE